MFIFKKPFLQVPHWSNETWLSHVVSFLMWSHIVWSRSSPARFDPRPSYLSTLGRTEWQTSPSNPILLLTSQILSTFPCTYVAFLSKKPTLTTKSPIPPLYFPLSSFSPTLSIFIFPFEFKEAEIECDYYIFICFLWGVGKLIRKSGTGPLHYVIL